MNYYYLISAGIVFLGVVLFFYLSSRRKYRDPTEAQNYEKVRNKLSTRKLKVEEEQEEESFGLFNPASFVTTMMGLAIIVFVVVIVMGTSQTVLSADSSAYNSINIIVSNVLSGVTGFFSSATPFFAIFAVLIIILALVVMVIVVSSFGFNDL